MPPGGSTQRHRNQSGAERTQPVAKRARRAGEALKGTLAAEDLPRIITRMVKVFFQDLSREKPVFTFRDSPLPDLWFKPFLTPDVRRPFCFPLLDRTTYSAACNKTLECVRKRDQHVRRKLSTILANVRVC